MPRIVITPHDITNSTITIRDPKAVHHLSRVLRVAVGESLECIDGQGRVYAGVIVSCARDVVTVRIERQREEPPPVCEIALLPALVKLERFEWMIEKATELGVAHIRPLLSQRTTVRPPAARSQNRLARWQRIATSAAAQCGRATVPSIEAPAPFEEAMQTLAGWPIVIPTLLERGPLLAAYLASHPPVPRIALVIGPEGDFTAEEVRLAQSHGAAVVSLGRLTLRAETAALATVTLVQAAAGEMAAPSSNRPSSA